MVRRLEPSFAVQANISASKDLAQSASMDEEEPRAGTALLYRVVMSISRKGPLRFWLLSLWTLFGNRMLCYGHEKP